MDIEEKPKSVSKRDYYGSAFVAIISIFFMFIAHVKADSIGGGTVIIIWLFLFFNAIAVLANILILQRKENESASGQGKSLPYYYLFSLAYLFFL